jgi:hypothetical protein
MTTKNHCFENALSKYVIPITRVNLVFRHISGHDIKKLIRCIEKTF